MFREILLVEVSSHLDFLLLELANFAICNLLLSCKSRHLLPCKRIKKSNWGHWSKERFGDHLKKWFQQLGVMNYSSWFGKGSDWLNWTKITRNVAKLVIIPVSMEWLRVKYPLASNPLKSSNTELMQSAWLFR